jgi:hypothetical protein
MTCCSFEASTKIYSRSPVRPSPDPVCPPGSGSSWTSPAASHRSLPILHAPDGDGIEHYSGPLKTTSLMRPRAALDTSSVEYVLCRIEDDASLTPVSEHQDILTGIAAGGYAVEVEDLEFAYALYAGDPSNGSSTSTAWHRSRRAGSAIGSAP